MKTLAPHALIAGVLLAFAAPLAAAQETYRVDLIIFLNQATPNGAPGEVSTPLDRFDIGGARLLGAANVRPLSDEVFGMPTELNRMRNARAFLPIMTKTWTQTAFDSSSVVRLTYGPELRVAERRSTRFELGARAEQNADQNPNQGAETFGGITTEPGYSSDQGQSAGDFRNFNTVDIHQMDGTIRLRKARYLHLDIDLWWVQESGSNSGRRAPTTGVTLAEDQLRVFRLVDSRRMRRDEVHYFDHPRFGVLAKVSRVE